MRVLECSSVGDKRFSALYAKVKIFGIELTIEEWYQFSKRFGPNAIGADTWVDIKYFSKWMKIDHIVVNNKKLDVEYLIPWYKLLWLIFLDNNLNLVKYASQFNDFHDKFKGSSRICQADVIRQYIKEGRNSVYNDCKELIEILNVGGVLK